MRTGVRSSRQTAPSTRASSRRYVAELNKPRIALPTIVGFVAAAGVGLVVGSVIR